MDSHVLTVDLYVQLPEVNLHLHTWLSLERTDFDTVRLFIFLAELFTKPLQSVHWNVLTKTFQNSTVNHWAMSLTAEDNLTNFCFMTGQKFHGSTVRTVKAALNLNFILKANITTYRCAGMSGKTMNSLNGFSLITQTAISCLLSMSPLFVVNSCSVSQI